jgi:hypothetical protein
MQVSSTGENPDTNQTYLPHRGDCGAARFRRHYTVLGREFLCRPPDFVRAPQAGADDVTAKGSTRPINAAAPSQAPSAGRLGVSWEHALLSTNTVVGLFNIGANRFNGVFGLADDGTASGAGLPGLIAASRLERT